MTLLLALLLSTAAQAQEPFRRHAFKPGETLRYDFEDTDTLFSAVLASGAVRAGDPFRVQEIRIPVKIEVLTEHERRLTVLPSADYRASEPAAQSKAPFEAVAKLPFSYPYKDDRDALDRLQTIFEKVRTDEAGKFLFFKMQDVHQMQESTESIPDGMLPGEVRATGRHRREGLGGDFVAAPSRMAYQRVEDFDGVKCGYFKSISLGHEFASGGMKTWTNFSYTVHVALEGPRQGLMLLGEGQETATVYKELKPQVMLQRQFSIRLR